MPATPPPSEEHSAEANPAFEANPNFEANPATELEETFEQAGSRQNYILEALPQAAFDRIMPGLGGG